MKIFSRIGARWRRWRRLRAARKRQDSPLREFVYLDEVSVYSLNASRLGPIAVEFTDLETRSLQAQTSSSIEVGAAGTKLGLGSQLNTAESQSTQVLRKSIVQSTFKEFYDNEQQNLLLRPAEDLSGLSEIRTIADLNRISSDSAYRGLVIRPGDLHRGSLAEVDAVLEAEDIFRFATIFASLMEMIEEKPDLFLQAGVASLEEAATVIRVLEKFMFGLIPIRARLHDYRLAVIGSEEWIIHTQVQAKLGIDDSQVTPIFVVGVAEQSLFWKDIRRVLFSGSRFRILCRLTNNGLQSSWTPVKLVDVVRDVLPDLATHIDLLGPTVLNSMKAGLPEAVPQTGSSDALLLAAKLYCREVASDQSALTEQQLDSFAESAVGSYSTPNLVTVRQIFSNLNLALEESGNSVDEERGVEVRRNALIGAGLGAIVGVEPEATTEVPPIVPAKRKERLLDSEFIAIFW
jgi:hypothetical protein